MAGMSAYCHLTRRREGWRRFWPVGLFLAQLPFSGPEAPVQVSALPTAEALWGLLPRLGPTSLPLPHLGSCFPLQTTSHAFLTPEIPHSFKTSQGNLTFLVWILFYRYTVTPHTHLQRIYFTTARWVPETTCSTRPYIHAVFFLYILMKDFIMGKAMQGYMGNLCTLVNLSSLLWI